MSQALISALICALILAGIVKKSDLVIYLRLDDLLITLTQINHI